MKQVLFILFLVSIVMFQGCNYNYYRGTQLEEQERFEEANIEYHRAYTRDPADDDFKTAYYRTALKVADDLMERYDLHINNKKYNLAYELLLKAQGLSPQNEKVVAEFPKWYRILLAGKVRFIFKSLKNQVPLSDEMALQIHFNTPNQGRKLIGKIDSQTQTYFVEDVLYDPPQNLLMFYTINAIGVNLISKAIVNPEVNAPAFKSNRYMKFVDLRTPALVKIDGSLSTDGKTQISVEEDFPANKITAVNSEQFKFPNRQIRYSLSLENKEIYVKSTTNYIHFLPQILYMNKVSNRMFLDFGELEVYQPKINGSWYFRRVVSNERNYLKDLKKNVLLKPYFYYREGVFLFLKESE
jgi:hypothetical protein